jgi:RNA polymerase sigma-70 factor (ECF subfamily)
MSDRSEKERRLKAEEEAIRFSLDGQPNRFRELVERYQRGVLSLCFRMVGRWHEAEDLAQQSFVDAFARLDTFDLKKPFWPWLCRIAVNNCRDFLKSRKRSEFPTDAEFSSQAGLSPAGWDNPEQSQLRRERVRILHMALMRVPLNYRTVLVLKDIEDLSYAEIRRVLRLPLTTLKMRVIRARQKLADAVDALMSESPTATKGETRETKRSDNAT